MSKVVVQVAGLRKRYGEVTAVDGVSFEVAEGEVFGILGPNGAGKTTTLEIIEGLRPSDSGQVLVDGLDMGQQRRTIQQRIGVQLQTATLPDFLRVGEALDMFAALFPQSVHPGDILDRLDLREKESALASELSGGQAQRLSLALALVNDPKLLFLDEPTTGLDPQARRAMWELISQVRKRGATLLLTTHYMEEAEVLCDRVAIMDRGKIVALDTPQELIAQHAAAGAIRCRLDGPAPIEELQQLPGVLRVELVEDAVLLHSEALNTSLVALVRLTERRSLSLDGLQVRSPSLEDVFLAVTGHHLPA